MQESNSNNLDWHDNLTISTGSFCAKIKFIHNNQEYTATTQETCSLDKDYFGYI